MRFARGGESAISVNTGKQQCRFYITEVHFYITSALFSALTNFDSHKIAIFAGNARYGIVSADRKRHRVDIKRGAPDIKPAFRRFV
jgi:hypothetical protein